MLANGFEVSRPASSRILLDKPRMQLAGSAPSSCWAPRKLLLGDDDYGACEPICDESIGELGDIGGRYVD